MLMVDIWVDLDLEKNDFVRDQSVKVQCSEQGSHNTCDMMPPGMAAC